MRTPVEGSGVLKQRQPTNRRRKVALRILGVYTHLNRMTVDVDFILPERQFLSCGDAQLPFHEIETGDHLGDRMLDLKPRVHFQEVETIGIGDEFHRAGPFVADSACCRDRGTTHR